MIRKVRLSQTAARKLKTLLTYLETEWSEKVKTDVLNKFQRKLSQILNFPESNKKSKKSVGLYQSVISKQTTIFLHF